jgi:hypothetical protein
VKATLGILLTLGFTQIAGCAFGTRYVALSYPPQQQVEMNSTATQPVTSGPRTQHVILAVNDARETTDRIGNVRNPLGMDTASILTEDNIAVWVHDAIAFELDRLGYQLLDHRGALSNKSTDRLTANVQNVFCDIYAVYDGEASLQATLERVGREPVTAEFPAKVSSGLSWAGSGSATGESLAQALQTSIRNLLRDFGFTD